MTDRWSGSSANSFGTFLETFQQLKRQEAVEKPASEAAPASASQMAPAAKHGVDKADILMRAILDQPEAEPLFGAVARTAELTLSEALETARLLQTAGLVRMAPRADGEQAIRLTESGRSYLAA
jgi:hypothetical protein